VDNHIIALRDDKLVLVAQGIGGIADQIEQSIATRFNVCAVLDIVRLPIPFSCLIVALVKQRVEGFEY
jgi:hypothetical protein